MTCALAMKEGTSLDPQCLVFKFIRFLHSYKSLFSLFLTKDFPGFSQYLLIKQLSFNHNLKRKPAPLLELIHLMPLNVHCLPLWNIMPENTTRFFTCKHPMYSGNRHSQHSGLKNSFHFRLLE